MLRPDAVMWLVPSGYQVTSHCILPSPHMQGSAEDDSISLDSHRISMKDVKQLLEWDTAVVHEDLQQLYGSTGWKPLLKEDEGLARTCTARATGGVLAVPISKWQGGWRHPTTDDGMVHSIHRSCHTNLPPPLSPFCKMLSLILWIHSWETEGFMTSSMNRESCHGPKLWSEWKLHQLQDRHDQHQWGFRGQRAQNFQWEKKVFFICKWEVSCGMYKLKASDIMNESTASKWAELHYRYILNETVSM